MNKPYKDVHASSYTPIDAFTDDLLTEEEKGISVQSDFLVV